MLFDTFESSERLALLPWLPDSDSVALSAEEADVLRRARVAAGDSAAAPVPLQTPFAGISVPPVEKQPACIRPPLTYWQTGSDPMPAPKAPDATLALSRWQEAVARFTLPAEMSFRRRYAALVGLAQTHARCLALSGQPDIPLLQSRRLWSALAACLWQSEQAASSVSADQLALLVVDLSGIQSYLFGTTNFGVGGVARSLRARSFFLSQITALFAWHLLDRLQLPQGNLLLDAGGKFNLLFAPTPRALAIVEEARCDAAKWCLDKLHGELALNAAYVGFPIRALTDGSFGDILKDLNYALAIEKQQRLGRALITPEDRWNQDAFVRSNPFGSGDPCRACGRFAQVDEGKCALCLRDVEVGKRLPRAVWLAYDRGQGNGADTIDAFGWRVQVGVKQEGAKGMKPPDTAQWVVALDGAMSPPDTPLPTRRLARYVPAAPNGFPLAFADMSKAAQGRPYLAYLKADVDRLGERFIFGFRDREGGHSLPRVGHLSGALDEFFSGWLETTLHDKFPHCYTVFSGGDDLTVIGPHDQIIRLSRLLPREFRRFLGYEGGSPTSTDVLTLSAGIALAQFRRPVATAIKLAEDALEQAKHAGRCRVALLDHALTWEDYEELLGKLWQSDGKPTEFGLELIGEERTGRKPEVSSAFVYHLLRYARMWEGYRQGQAEQLHYQPLLAYDIGRNVDARKTPHTHRWASWLAQIHLSDGGDWRQAMDNLGVLARLVLLNRKGHG